jgi:5-formyltetrahydrofolate cyclo-ligase
VHALSSEREAYGGRWLPHLFDTGSMDAAHTAEAGGSFPRLSAMQKADLRSKFLAVAMARPEEEIARASQVIEARVRELPEFQSAQVLAMYHAMPSEPATRGLIGAALGLGKQVVLPLFGHDEPELGFFVSWDRLVPGPLGIAQPAGPAIPIARVDLFLVPGLAFDRAGFRLGRGKGYYDRLLARRSPQALMCGVCFDDVLVERLPRESHDIPMDRLLTPAATSNPRDSVGYPLD